MWRASSARRRRSASAQRPARKRLADAGSGILDELFAVIQDRKREMPEGSYTTQLFNEGVERIAQKVIEEAGE